MSNPINDGGPAFPHLFENGEAYLGMSLRDYFAGMALQGMLAANAQSHDELTDKNVDYVIAREAYRSADAMLAERSKQ